MLEDWTVFSSDMYSLDDFGWVKITAIDLWLFGLLCAFGVVEVKVQSIRAFVLLLSLPFLFKVWLSLQTTNSANPTSSVCRNVCLATKPLFPSVLFIPGLHVFEKCHWLELERNGKENLQDFLTFPVLAPSFHPSKFPLEPAEFYDWFPRAYLSSVQPLSWEEGMSCLSVWLLSCSLSLTGWIRLCEKERAGEGDREC